MRSFAVLFLLPAIAGCGGSAAVDHAPAAAPCETRVPAATRADTVTVVLFDTVDLSHAPWGRNREERFVFGHLYETLLTTDCHGEFRSGLARRVIEASDGWLVELRDDAVFWDETPVTAWDVAESFKPAIRNGIAIKSVDPVDDHSLILHGDDGRPDLELLTLPMLAVTKAGGGGMPLGSGAWVIDETISAGEAVVMRPIVAPGAVVRFVRGDASDARDTMDGSADAMITDDAAVIEYARGQRTALLTPLAWDRVYVLVSRARREMVQRAGPVTDLPRGVCDAFARDAVPVDARGGSSILTDAWRLAPVHIAGREPVGNHAASRQLLFGNEDPTARALAERIVALAAMDTSTSAAARALRSAAPDLAPGVRAAGLSADELAKRLHSHADDAAYVVTLSWCADFPFLASRFVQRAPWLTGQQRLSEVVIPLVETRAHFIALTDRVGFVDDHAGNVRILIPSPGVRR